MPIGVAESKKIDNENDNKFWQDTIKKEMENSQLAFQLLGPEDKSPVGYKEITSNFIFDVKMDLTQKAQYMSGGHSTDPTSSMTYASVVSQESVRIDFLIVALNELDFLAEDIHHEYLNVETKEKSLFYVKVEWKYDQGKLVITARSLNGLK